VLSGVVRLGMLCMSFNVYPKNTDNKAITATHYNME